MANNRKMDFKKIWDPWWERCKRGSIPPDIQNKANKLVIEFVEKIAKQLGVSLEDIKEDLDPLFEFSNETQASFERILRFIEANGPN